MPLRRRLMMAAAGAVPFLTFLASPAAMAQGGTGGVQGVDASFAGQSQSFSLNTWTASFLLNTTDNFSRIEEGEFQRLFQNDDGVFFSRQALDDNGNPVFTPAGQPVFEIVTDTVDIDAVPKTFGTVTLSGLSAFKRPALRGLVRGQVRVGTYFNDDTLADENADSINANAPQDALDAGFRPTIGDNGGVRDIFVDPNISGIVDLDIIGDALGIEAGGFVVEQSRIQGSQLQQQQPGQDFNEVILGGLFVSPVFRATLPSDQEIELRYRNSSVVVIDEFGEDSNFGGFGARQEINDSFSNEVSFAHRSGNAFGGLKTEFEVVARETKEEASDRVPEQTLDQLSTSLAVKVPANDQFFVVLTGGYDDMTGEADASPILDPNTMAPISEARTEDYSGFFYSLGFDYKPTRESHIRLALGERFQGLLVEADAQTALTPRLRFGLSANRQVGSAAQAQQEEFQFLNLAVLNLIDQLRQSNESLSERSLGRSSLPLVRGISATGRSNFGIRRSTQVRAQLIGNYGRTNFVLRANAILFDDDGNPLGNRGGGRDQYSSLATISRRVSRRLQVSLAAQNLYLEGNGGGGNAFGAAGFDSIFDQFYTLQGSYQLSQTWALTGSYQHLRRNVQGFEQEPLSLFSGTLFEYKENQLRAGLQILF